MVDASPGLRAIQKVESRITHAFGPDRHGLKRDINRIKQSIRQAHRKGHPPTGRGQKLEHVTRKINASIKKRRERIKNRPVPADIPALPITAKKDDIIAAIQANPVVIIAGETGSGKTTQIPKFCLAAGRGIDGLIGCTQPRRIAAVSVANRIAEELGETPGRSVGYKIRFHEKTGPNAYVKIMTDGILLAETQGDRFLDDYDTLIVDEAHERSLNIDFILGILKTLVRKRKDLKLIITSATIDTEKFSRAFDNAPIIEVSGRTYPVEIRYEPSPGRAKTAEAEDLTPVEKAALAIDRLMIESRFGDILVFMPTEQDIRETIEILEGRQFKGVTLLPLFARLSAQDQARVFSNSPGRKIIVATNIAETSLTIPGIKYVVDTGLARISRYNPRSRTTALPVTPISKSSADQRMGRCGRVENGICVRLYSQEDYEDRARFTRPEILRANLAEVILRMIALNLGDIAHFPFLDTPLPNSIQDGFNLLLELGAIVPSPGKAAPYQLTPKGKLMAGMPLDPRLSCMMIEAETQGCLSEITVIAAALSVQDPRERPAEKAAQADQAHASFKDPFSDFITLLNIWNRYRQAWQRQKKLRDIKKFCTENFMSFKRIREWRDIHGQLQGILKDTGIAGKTPSDPAPQKTSPDSEFGDRYEKIHKSILSGFLSNIAQKKEGNFYQAGKGRQAMIFPGSVLFNKTRPWIVAAEMVETSRLFARMAAAIDPEWLEPIAKDRCKYTHLHPRWERRRGTVVATEQVSLFGLIIVPNRTVTYGRINPEQASDIFIQNALVDGDVRRPLPFMRRNRKLIDSLRGLENKIRRRDVLVSDDDLFRFYKNRLENVFDIRTLERRIRKKGGDRFLHLSEADLIRSAPDEAELAQFPDKIRIEDRSYACDYQFEPGRNADGITVRIPAAESGAVSPEKLDWLVPGLYKEKIAALIKSLPKTYRKCLVPVSDTVEIIIGEMPQTDDGLIPALGEFIYRRFQIDIPATAWDEDQLPDHLKMRIAITDPNGREIAADRDKAILQRNFSTDSQPDGFEAVKQKWEKTGITQWDFDDLPERITLKGKKGQEWIAFPALVPNESGAQHVDLKLFRQKHEALKAHIAGVCRLYTHHLSRDLKLLKKMIALPRSAAPKAAYFGGEKKIQAHIIESITADLFAKNVRTRKDFDTQAHSASTQMVTVAQKRLDAFIPVLDAIHDTRATLFDLENTARHHATPVLQQVREELASLAPENLITLYDNTRMAHLPRYIRALGIRAVRGVENPDRDHQRAQQITIYADRLQQMLNTLSPVTSEKKQNAIEEFFWMLEEYKVSVFAQELKTAIPVSPKRLEKKIGEIERMI